MNKIVIVAALGLVLSGCSKMVETDPNDLDTNKILYAYDKRTGLCFSFITVKKVNTNADSSYSISHSNVPCTDKVKEHLTK